MISSLLDLPSCRKSLFLPCFKFGEVYDGASRFEDALSTSEQRIPNRAGFFRVNDHGVREFLVLPEAFRRDVCNGFDLKAATAALIAAGWLAPGEGTRATQKPRIQGIGTTRCYVFTGRMWEDD